MPQIKEVNERGEPRMMSGGGKGLGEAGIRIEVSGESGRG
jgi:hypothetical protein